MKSRQSEYAKVILVVCCALLNFTAFAADRVTGQPFSLSSPVLASNGMAATSQPLATQAAIDVLKSGGNAVDAAIAANAVLGLVEPTGNGIGGDLFAIIWDADSKQLYGLNGSGRSPKAISRQWFVDNSYTAIPKRGALPVSVPGTVDAWFAMHERFGSKPMGELLAPAIDYAQQGFPVTQYIAWLWDRYIPILGPYPGFLEQFAIDGRAPVEGEIFKNPNLANTLRAIAIGGRDAFYTGDIARAMAEHVQAQGGFLSVSDLAEHRSDWVEPVSTNYRGYDVWQLPPNGQGIAVLQMLNLLEPYDVKAMGRDSADFVHLMTEVKKVAFADRAKYYADPEFNKLPVAELISKRYARKRGELINMQQAAMKVEAGDPKLRDGDTIYLTTADSEGNMVSLIQSNYRGMGSGMAPAGLGFILQNRGEMFSLDENHFNSLEGGKRPFHTIIPAFVTKDGKPWMSFGLMGGGMQPQGHVQILVNMIDFGMNVQEAGDAPRMHHTGSSQPTGEEMHTGGVLNLETGFSYTTIRELMRRGHILQYADGPYGGYQAIMRAPNGVYWGATESRKDGNVIGY